MPRFLPEYRTIDTRSTGERVILGISLFILLLFMPATVLGYYAEKSIPGQALYPIKRGLESAVLAVESVSPYSKSHYYQQLAQTRVDETSTLIAEAATTGDTAELTTQTNATLTDAYTSIQQAAVSIQTISDPTQKQKAQEELTTSIRNYQTQLAQMAYTIQKNNTSIEATPTPTQPPSGASNITQGLVIPTPIPDETTVQTTLQNQINQTQDNLQNILQQTAPPPAPFPSSMPKPTSSQTTITPSPTVETTPTPESAPWWQPWQQRGRQQGENNQKPSPSPYQKQNN